nr:laccase-like [Leptinotarsa decemlineata]
MVDYSEKSIHLVTPKMSGMNLMLIRASIVLGMVAAVVTLLYLTPVPDQNFKSCDRPCHDLDWPMICRVTMHIEMLKSNIICDNCQDNSTECSNSFCSITDSSSRGIITANRQLPGPSIHVCHNDILVVNVVNKIPGHSLSIHWRGQPNNEAPFMDGVPMVTQCPISSYTTFQYQFRASSPGTHFYHAHSDTDRSSGLFGAIVVRQTEKAEHHRKQYDADLEDHMILLSEWSPEFNGETRSILINGKGSGDTIHAVFRVTKGKRFRFRVAHVGGTTGCPMTLAIDNHLLKIISLDGNPIKPYEASSIKLAKGERLDFILKTNQKFGTYEMKVNANCEGNDLNGKAVIRYEGSTLGPSLPTLDFMKSSRIFDTSLAARDVSGVSLSNVRSFEKIDSVLKNTDVDVKLYLGFDYVDGKHFSIQGEDKNNITFVYPSSPLLTQPADVPLDSMCNESNWPARCAGKITCECVHVEHVPLGSTAEIILIDQGGDDDEYIFHLHGYHFYVVGSRIFETPPLKNEVIDMDKSNNLMKRNLMNPVRKDTIRVPRNGVVALRFLADNPGFWLLRDEKSEGWTRGMDILTHVP